MPIELNHTIVPTRDKVAAAKFFATILGLSFQENAVGYFAPVRVKIMFGWRKGNSNE